MKPTKNKATGPHLFDKILRGLPTRTTLDFPHDKEFLFCPSRALKKFKEQYGFELKPSLYCPVTIKWSMKNFGFGELVFWVQNGRVHCDNERMSRERVKKILCTMVDQAVMKDPVPRRKKK